MLSPKAGPVEFVIAVDSQGRDVAAVEKLEAHRSGIPHRAISIMLANNRREVLLQRRSADKYHCGGMWANTCCGHPRPGEAALDAAQRRLYEELYLVCQLRPAGLFRYSAKLGGGLIENELVYLFVGIHHGPVTPNPDEVMELKWVASDGLADFLAENSAACTPWFRRYVAELPRFVTVADLFGLCCKDGPER